MLCFRKFPVAKFMDKRGGVSRFSVENFLSHSFEKLRRGTILCFTKFLVSKKVMHKREGEEKGSITTFCRNFFCLAVRKNFVGEPFSAMFQKISGSEVYG